ncbi:Transcriptional corepressor SEUSS [Acorus gramineus]|uniref:Transcriptional corepressor SEUSS n=1 Tax=Acorus gramineus TaxID=55184 RepID=A0AAV9BI36_ACOGR|nr:Transcriptional corepressor SEUSS [Acorus gramineus]
MKPNVYEPGTCARRLTHYMYHQQHRPADNNIEFWRKFVAEYYAPNAKKRWCVSLYGSGRQTTGVFPQDVWHCEICNRRPGRGFETTVEVLPRLCKIKYDSGTLEELLYVDMPHEYQNVSGQIVLDYAKAIQESVFEQLRVVRDGQLRIVFSPDLKIVSWEFCARRHEELIPRRLIIPQVSQLGTVAQKYQAATQNASSNLSTQELQNSCNLFVASARQLAKSLEVPLVNDLGYTKRYVRCLQISEVVNSMKDLIDYSRETGSGPMASLINFPRRTSTSSALHSQGLLPDEQAIGQSSNNDQKIQNAAQSAPGQLSAGNNGIVNVNKTLSSPSTSAPTSTIVSLLHQNSMNSRQQQPSQENPMSNSNSSYGGNNSVQIPSASSSTSPLPPPQSQTNLPSSPFPSPPLSSSNNPTQASPRNVLPSSGTTSHLNSTNLPGNILPQQLAAQSNEADPNDSQIAMQQLLQEIIMSTQGGALGNDMKGMNDISSVTINGGLVGSNGMTSSSGGIGGMGFGNMGGMGSSATVSGLRAAMTNNAMALNGRIGGMNSMVQDSTMNSHPQQQDTGNRLTSGLGTLNNFNNQFDF